MVAKRPKPVFFCALILLSGAVVVAAACWAIFGGRPSGAVPGPDEWFAQACDVVPGESARFIPPPYLPPRQARYAAGWGGGRPPPGRTGQIIFVAGHTERYSGLSGSISTLRGAIADCGDLAPAELEMPPDLGRIMVDGDWTIRFDAPRDQRLKAAESILQQAVNRPIRIEKRLVTREVIVARGDYAFRSLGRGARPNGVQFFTDTLDPPHLSESGGDLKILLEHIEGLTGRRVINEARGGGRQRYSDNHSVLGMKRDPATVDLLLENLSKQTSLTFSRETREVEIYFVSEETR